MKCSAAPTVKRVCHELGGKSPYIITADADLEAAVRYGVEDVMLNTGQTCNALTRMFVPRSRYEEAVNIAREEIFGPVLCMIVYDDIEVAIEMANDTIYGLASGVYAKDKASALKIARRIRAGQCYIQGSYFNIDAPFGGYKQSGNGREWGDQAMHEYFETKAIIA
jgi:aldehyde dehydrogenase (NAD+)